MGNSDINDDTRVWNIQLRTEKIFMLHCSSLQSGWDRVPLKSIYKATVVDLFLSVDRLTAQDDRTASHISEDN